MYAAYAVFVALALAASLVWIGFQLANGKLEDDQEKLHAERQMLDVELDALERARKINDVFFRARDEMRRATDEADGSGVGRPPRTGAPW